MASAALEDEVKKLEEDLEVKLTSFKEREAYSLPDNNGGAASIAAFKYKQHGKQVKPGDKVNGVSWIDNEHIAVALQANTVVVYNVFAKDNPARSFYVKSTWLNCLAVKKDTAGTDQCKIAYGGLDNEITVSDFMHKTALEGGEGNSEDQKEKIFQKHGGPIYDISWCTGANEFASGSGDSTIMVWSLDQPNNLVKEPLRTFNGHTADVASLSWIDTNLLLSGSGDSTCRLFDKRVNGAGIVQTFAGHGGAVASVCTMNNNQSFASCSEDETVRVWDIRSKSCFATYGESGEDKESWVGKTAMGLSKSGRMAFVGNAAGSIDVIDLLTGEQNCVSSKYHTEAVTSCELSPSGNAVATSSRDKAEGANPPCFAIWA